MLDLSFTAVTLKIRESLTKVSSLFALLIAVAARLYIPRAGFLPGVERVLVSTVNSCSSADPFIIGPKAKNE